MGRGIVKVSPRLIDDAIFNGQARILRLLGADDRGNIVLELEGADLPEPDAAGVARPVSCEITVTEAQARAVNITFKALDDGP